MNHVKESAGTELCEIVSPLLAWYDSAARVLPWRENPEPYRVWVSEIMLQQTRVEAVKPYFERFLASLPTVTALAEAPEEQLLKLWEGLGYYNRARNLQKAARVIAAQYGGELPASFEALKALPGFGEYTAGAVASIAFGIPVPAVDGNVLRVISRLCASYEDILDPKVKKRVAEEIRSILPKGRVGDFNQALMELGATVCVPNGMALCERCPLAGLCRARAQGVVMELPVKTPKKQRRIEARTVFVITCKNRAAIRRRPEKGLLAGLWELPNVPGALSREQAIEQLSQWGVKAAAVEPLEPSKHIFTHLEWHMTAWAVEAEGEAGDSIWASRRELSESYTLPFAFKAYFDPLRQRISVDI